MARSLSVIIAGAVPTGTASPVLLETKSVITTLSQSVVALIRHLVLVNAWRGTSEMRSINPEFLLAVVVEAVLIPPRARTKQAISNPKRAKTCLRIPLQFLELYIQPLLITCPPHCPPDLPTATLVNFCQSSTVALTPLKFYRRALESLTLEVCQTAGNRLPL